MNTVAISTEAEAHQATVLLAAIEAMEATLALAEAFATERRPIDLDGLEDEIGRLCIACLAAPRNALPALRARLTALVGLIDRLRAAMAPP